MTARSAVDLPEPDSPTSPTISFWCRVRSSSFTAGKSSPPTAKLTVRFLISTSGSGIAQRVPEVEPVAQALAEKIEADDGGADGERGPEQGPEGDRDVLLRLVDHETPISVGRLGAEAQIAERGSSDEREADVDAALHDDGRPHARQDLAVLDVERAFSAGPCRRDIVLARRLEHGAPHDAHELGRCGHAQGEHGLPEPGAETDDHKEGEHERGNREERVHEAHDDLIQAPAVEPGGERDG